MRLPLACVLVVTACAATPPVEISPEGIDGKADGLARKLKLRDDYRIDVDEPSDLAFHDGRLYTVSDRHAKIYRIDDDGDVKVELDVEVDDPEVVDFEALAIDEHGRFYIGDEGESHVWRLGPNGEREAWYEVDVNPGNSGIEGLAFDDDGHMFVANEKDPARVMEYDASSGEETYRATLDFADDISALAWNAVDGHLYALSDQERKLFRLDYYFDKITSWKLPLARPEGLAFDGDTVYIVSESEERLYVFELD